jgi:hypothetical protein
MSDGSASQKVTIKLDKRGRFSIEKLRPLLGDKTDTIKSYTVEIVDDGVILQLFDEEGNKYEWPTGSRS